LLEAHGGDRRGLRVWPDQESRHEAAQEKAHAGMWGARSEDNQKKPAAALGAMAAASPRPRLAAGKKRQRLEVEKKPASAQLEVEEKPASVQLEEAKEARQVKRKPAIAQLEGKPASAQLEEEKKPASAQLEPEQEEEEEEEEPEQEELSAQQEGEPEQGEEDTGRMHFLNLTQLLREPGLPS